MLKKLKANKKLRGVLIIAVIVIAVAVYLKVSSSNAAQANMITEKAALRDISMSKSFTGTITASNYSEIIPDLTGYKITEIFVKEGDQVKAGDVIATLDTEGLKNQIAQQEANLRKAANQAGVAYQQANKTYTDYKTNLEDGLNTQIQGAVSQLDGATSNLVAAQRGYNDEVALNNKGMSSAIIGAQSAVTSTYNQVQEAQRVLKAIPAGGDKSAAELSLSSAWAAYNQAVKSYEAAKITEESTLTSKYDALITAQTNYLNSVDSYNAAVRGAQQTLGDHALSLQAAAVNTDNTAMKLQIENLQRDLSRCNMVAPVDGTITELVGKVGDLSAKTAICKVTDFSVMHIKIKIGEYDVSDTEIGDKVNVHVEASGIDYEG